MMDGRVGVVDLVGVLVLVLDLFWKGGRVSGFL